MEHLPALIADLGLILSVAAVTTIVSRMVKQPVVLGYIVAGFLVGPHVAFIPTVLDEANIRTWSEIGVIFLLFSLGLEFSFKKLAKVGSPAAITALITVSLMLGAGFVTGRALGWSTMDSIFLGGILCISSTTIIFRAFDELGLKTTSFASLVLGVLVVEDLVAILLLVLLSTVAVSQNFSGTELLFEMGKLGFFLVLWFTVGIFLIPTLLRSLRRWMTDEMLLILSVALCLAMVKLAVAAGFSAALGAFVMGSLLAETTKAERIEHLVAPVKDLFGAIFFVSVGMMIDPQVLVGQWALVLVISAVTLIGQPLTSTLGALVAGQPLHTAVRAGMSLSQIGEFSFIIATLGLSLHVTSDMLYPIAVAVSAVTTFTTPYMIKAGVPMQRIITSRMPRRWLEGITSYSDQSSQVRAISAWRELLRAYLVNTVLHGVVALAIVLLCVQYVAPLFAPEAGSATDLSDDHGGPWVGLIALAAILPSIWAIAIRRIHRNAYRGLWLNRKLLRGPLVALELLRIGVALLLLAFVVVLFFPAAWAFAVVPAFVLVALFFFRRRLQGFYQRVESHFLLNLNQRTQQEQRRSPSLAPWDMHLAKLVMEHAPHVVGYSLGELGLRETFGINIAMIERGDRSIPVPGRDERLFPGDVLHVLGTDDQLERLSAWLNETDERSSDAPLQQEDLELMKFEVGVGSPLEGVTIRSSGLREQANALVVGIERGSRRLLNPDGTETFKQGDIVWAAGHGRRLREFIHREPPAR